jgi:hypothetical protein
LSMSDTIADVAACQIHAWWFIAHSLIRGGIDKVHVGLEIKPAS